MGGAASEHENELVLDVLGLTEPAFAVNASRQIVAWNDGAERLLGLRADDVIGMRCYDALATSVGAFCGGCDYACEFAVDYQQATETSGAHTAFPTGVAPTPPRRRQRHVRVTTLSAHTRSGQLRMVHLLRVVSAQREASGEITGATTEATPHEREPLVPVRSWINSAPLAVDAAESASKPRRPTSLTQRELEVLRLLGAGHSTDDIARELSITRVTARNHVNKVLDKLGVNSRLQAVVIASQLQLI